MTARSVTQVLALTLAVSGCATIRNGQPPSHQFLERIYVGKTHQDSSILYEAQAVTHIFLIDGLPDAYDRLSSDANVRAAGAWRVIATPMFRVRQLRDSSAAVRTPSFMPRVSIERLWATRLGPISGDPTFPAFGGVRVAGVRLTLAHHSNGQAGCFRDGFVPVDSRANICKPGPGTDTAVVKLNRADGDFSTTFLNVIAHSTWMNRNGSDVATRSIGAAIGADWNIPGIFGSLSDEQRSLYGSWRIRLQAEAMQAMGTTCADRGARSLVERIGCGLRGHSRLTFEGERAPKDPGDLAKRIHPSVLPYRISLELSHSFDALLGAGAFIRWHDGQDYYNIGFVNRRKVTMFGAMLDLSGIDRIGKKIVQ
jgi:hypothetical protein